MTNKYTRDNAYTRALAEWVFVHLHDFPLPLTDTLWLRIELCRNMPLNISVESEFTLTNLNHLKLQAYVDAILDAVPGLREKLTPTVKAKLRKDAKSTEESQILNTRIRAEEFLKELGNA